MSNEPLSLDFYDEDNDQDAAVVVRAIHGSVGLCLRLQEFGEVEVFIPIMECEAVVEALQRALIDARLLEFTSAGNQNSVISFYDDGNRQNAAVIVRTLEGSVGLCLSLEKNGDPEVCLPLTVCTVIVEAIQQAWKPSSFSREHVSGDDTAQQFP